MPLDPNQKMHQLLEACARKQRERVEAPLEMHPATRRLLQDEVGRVYRSPRTAFRSLWSLPSFWPGMAVATSLVLLVFATLLLIRWDSRTSLGPTAEIQSKEMRLAKDSSVPAPAPAQDLSAGRALAESISEEEQRVHMAFAPAVRPELDPEWASNAPRYQFGLPPQKESLPSENKVTLSGAAPRERYIAPPKLADSGVSLSEPAPALGRPGSKPTAARLAPAPTIDTAASPEQSEQLLGLAQLESSEAATVVYFNQIDQSSRYRQNLNSPPNPQVLTTFQMRQSGENLRIIDADGSIYEGNIQLARQQPLSPAQAATPAPTVPARGFRTAPAEQAAAVTPSFSFRAVGTNRTLNQLVEFTGNLQPATPGAEIQAGAIGGGGAAAELLRRDGQQTRGTHQAARVEFGHGSAQAASNVIQQQIGRIEGRVTVGRSEFKIEAVPAGP
jgi:hypothetical protein